MVLAILGIISTLAVRRMGAASSEWRNDRSVERTREIAEAIAGRQEGAVRDGTVRGLSGEIIATSFVSDLGRLPRAWPRTPREGDRADRDDPARQSLLTLDELFVRGEETPVWGRCDVAVTVGVERAVLTVPLQFGWRGPYLRESSGAAATAYVGDAYGDTFAVEAEIGRDASRPAILPDEGLPITNGFAITRVRSCLGLKEYDFSVTNSVWVRNFTVSWADEETGDERRERGWTLVSAGAQGGIVRIDERSPQPLKAGWLTVGRKSLLVWARQEDGRIAAVTRFIYLSDGGDYRVAEPRR